MSIPTRYPERTGLPSRVRTVERSKVTQYRGPPDEALQVVSSLDAHGKDVIQTVNVRGPVP